MVNNELENISNAKVSIITPVRTDKRRDSYLLEAYESLLTQTYENWEWMIVVDGDKEHMSEISALFNDSRIVILNTGRRAGAAAARNIGLIASSGEYITSLDDDDLLPKDSIKVRADYLSENQKNEWVCGYLADLKQSDSVNRWDHPLETGSYYKGEAEKYWLNPNDVFMAPPTAILARKEAILSVGGWGGAIQGEDLMMAAALLNSYAGTVIDETVYLYRKHADQTMESVGFDDHELSSRTLAWHRMRSIN